MVNYVKEQAITWFKNLVRKKGDQGWEISKKYNILTVEEKQVALIRNRIKISLERNPVQRELKKICLKAPKMRIMKRTEKENNYCQILVEKYVEGSYR